MSRHRPPPRPPLITARRVAIADGALLALSLTVAAAATFAPHPRQPVTVAAPTAVEKTREPTGHGGPLAPPTFADPHVWNEGKGRVIVDGQALPQPTVVLAPVVALEPEPAPAPVTAATPVVQPAPAPAPEPQPQPQPEPEPVVVPEPVVIAEPTDEPVVEEPVETDVPEPVETEPAENTEPPAEPTVPVVVEVVP